MCAPANSNSRLGFTLLEVMTATMIVSLLSFSVYRFLSAQLAAIHVSQEVVEDHESMESAARFLQAELAEMPPHGENELLGQPNQFHGAASDEITWLCHGWHGVMTSAAPGRYRVTLAVQPVAETSSELELGLRRQPMGANAGRDMDFYTRGTAGSKYSWLPILRPMYAMEIRYFDRRLNAWVERWDDPISYPQLIRLRLWKHEGDAPFETVLTVPAANVTL